MRNPKQTTIGKLSIAIMMRKPWGPAAWKAYYKNFYPGQPPADLGAHRDRIKASLDSGDHWRSFVKTLHTDHTPAEQQLDRVKAPALVVMGEKDPDWPDPAAEARFAVERLNAELLLLPDTGHYPMAQRPEAVNPALKEFLEKSFARA